MEERGHVSDSGFRLAPALQYRERNGALPGSHQPSLHGKHRLYPYPARRACRLRVRVNRIMAITIHEHHGHEHDGAVGPHTHLTSVGIDIGSSTSHLMFSQLLIGYPSLHQRRPMVLERRVIARSPILLMPFSGVWTLVA